ncbi:hypothetical protein POVWA2_061070 [Plasmodium ovale wallikeri]|uniref:Uncharacterized protein n=1 Tax=Plasmodium ovale wallikeri TaxID=864142 RepID=A0A1A9A2T6_PLAOA|nr:hypothetical protein POVWA1_061520 [Plasmodium ovale wallikeri]SBT50866.1 hypothetical protein POVWA2_061070 [Plasmodium ovale wallikeri]
MAFFCPACSPACAFHIAPYGLCASCGKLMGDLFKHVYTRVCVRTMLLYTQLCLHELTPRSRSNVWAESLL